jgi:16S rRNA (cytosine967-C5)-methyltransferase
VQGRLVAMDVNAARLKGLPRMAKAQGFADFVKIRSGDLRMASALPVVTRGASSQHQTTFPFEFDRVLVDAPCSGLGVLSKRADIRWRRTLADVRDLTDLQVLPRLPLRAWVLPDVAYA